MNLVDLIASDGDRTSRLSARQITQVREALASIETLVELAAPPEQPRKARKK